MTKKKNKSGRPQIVLTDEQIVKVEELSAYLNCEQIAEYFSFSEDTFYELKKRDTRILRAYKKGKAEKIYRYAKKLENKAMGIDEAGDTTAIIFYLKTQAGWSTENKNENKTQISFDSTTSAEMFNSGLNAFKEGKIDFTQMQQIGNLALTKMNIESHDKVDKTEYEQQSRQEALEFAAKIKEARENIRFFKENNTKSSVK